MTHQSITDMTLVGLAKSFVAQEGDTLAELCDPKRRRRIYSQAVQIYRLPTSQQSENQDAASTLEVIKAHPANSGGCAGAKAIIATTIQEMYDAFMASHQLEEALA